MSDDGTTSVWRSIARYQWMVLLIAWMGWVFDSMDSTLYVMVLTPALKELLGAPATEASIASHGGTILALFLIGWAVGGVLFGVFADRFGRTRALVWTILIYAVFTGLAALSRTWWQLAGFRFLTAVGVGGEWAAGAALVAEVWPLRARTIAAGVLQSAWAVGVFFAAVVNYFVGPISWRAVFLVGVLPAVVALIVRRNVREPEIWQAAADRRRHAGLSLGPLKELFRPDLRRGTVVGLVLACAAVFGLWGVTYWTPVLLRHLPDTAQVGETATIHRVSFGVMALNAGALLGYLVFALLAGWAGRRWAFAGFYLGALVTVPILFAAERPYGQVLWLLPALGFFTNGVFTGFAIYFPELYPTRLRATGAGFCFNSARIIASTGPFMTGALVGALGSFHRAVTVVGLIYVLGLAALPFAPETKGRDLPA